MLALVLFLWCDWWRSVPASRGSSFGTPESRSRADQVVEISPKHFPALAAPISTKVPSSSTLEFFFRGDVKVTSARFLRLFILHKSRKVGIVVAEIACFRV